MKSGIDPLLYKSLIMKCLAYRLFPLMGADDGECGGVGVWE
jgi:hypothetical protein